MKKQSILNLNISSINDITKIEESCKYIDLDLTNYSSEVINYFLKNGSNYMYSEIINNKKGYVYVDYEIFARGEHIINLIYQNMHQNLNEQEKAKYLYPIKVPFRILVMYLSSPVLVIYGMSFLLLALSVCGIFPLVRLQAMVAL